MSPLLLGILNSQAAGAAGGMDLLEENVLTSTASSVTFSSLGSYSDYRYLQTRVVTRTTTTSVANGLLGVRLNGDSGLNYYTMYIFGNGSNPSAGFSTNQNYALMGLTNSAQNDTNAFGAHILDFDRWNNTTDYTTIRSVGGRLDPQGTAYRGVSHRGATWKNTAALTSIQFFDNRGYDFVAGSRFSLYGVK